MIPFTDAHTHHPPADSSIVCILAQTEPVIPDTAFSCGVHPMSASSAEIPAAYRTCFSAESCRAIGECGLDRRSALPLPEQTRLFRAHIAVSEELHKPLVIHMVRTRVEFLRLYQDVRPTVPWIVHGCRGNERHIRELADAGLILSFGDGLLRDAGILEGFFHKLPEDSLLIETDESQADLRALYAAGAAFRSLDAETFKAQIYRNFQRIFYHAEL